MKKQKLCDLAIFGGNQAFVTPVHSNRPNLGDRELFQSYIDRAFDERALTNHGPIACELERKLETHLGVDNCVLASSGTSALLLVIKALGLSGRVIIPSFTFISTPHILHWNGIKPVFCDIDSKGWNLSADHCEALIDDSISAVIATHCWGDPCEIERLEDMCGQSNIPLIFDAAHGFDCTYKNQKIGRFGTAEIFSFHATKLFHTIEGGAITTPDADLADQLRKMRNFGFSGYDETEFVGTNAKMSEIHAAMGLANLAQIETTIEKCKDVYSLYKKNLQGISGLDLHDYNGEEKSNYHYVIALIDPSGFGLSRDRLIEILHRENILARRYYYPGCHRLEPYKTLSANSLVQLPVTEAKSDNIIVLPAGADISQDDVLKICGILKFISENASQIDARFGEDRSSGVANDVA